MAGYARVLYEHGAQYSDETTLLYEEVTKIGQKAAFSPHPDIGLRAARYSKLYPSLKKGIKSICKLV